MTYIEKLHARFGPTPPGLPFEAWLAMMENIQMRKAMGLPPNGIMQGIGSGVVTEEMRIKLRAAALAKGKERMEEMLKFLRQPMTVEDLVLKTGWSRTTVRRAMNKAVNENRIVLLRKIAPQVWQVRQEAAE